MEQKERFRFAPRYTRVAAYHTPWPRLCLPPVGLWQCVLILLGLLSKDCSELSGIQETARCFFLSGPLFVIGRINNFEGLGRIFTDLHPSSPRLQGQQVFNGRILCSHHGPRSSLRLSQRHECLKEAQAPNATESKIRTTTSCKNGTCVLSFPAQPTKLGSGLVCQGLLQVVNCKSLHGGTWLFAHRQHSPAGLLSISGALRCHPGFYQDSQILIMVQFHRFHRAQF